MRSIAMLADGKNTTIKAGAVNGDIIRTIHSSFSTAVEQTKHIAPQFKGADALESAAKVYRYLRSGIRYKRDPAKYQDIRLPARLVKDGYGDCKSFALFAAGVMANLGYPVTFRYVSYGSDPVPSHVYIVADGVVLDGVYKLFNTQLPFTHKYDYKMDVRRLSGIDYPGKNLLVSTSVSQDIGKIRLRKFIKKNIKSAGRDIKKVAKKINPKTILSAIKKQAFFIPRKAFLAMVALNARGLATRLSQLNDTDKADFWVKKFGGKLSTLNSAINRGKKKKPLFGANHKVKSIKGIGAVVCDKNEIGAVPQLAAIIAAAAPILIVAISVLTKKKIPDPSNGLLASEAGSGDPSLFERITDFAQQAAQVLQNGGDPGSFPTGSNDEEIKKALPGDEDETAGSSFELSPMLLIGGAALLYFATKK